VAPHSLAYLQIAMKTFNCRYKQTKYYAVTDKRRYRWSDNRRGRFIAELECA